MTDQARLYDIADKATPGPWGWFGNVDNHHVFLGTVHRGRIFVMGFRRWGMQGAQPEFIKQQADIPKPYGVITPASEHVVREVPYRGDIVDIDLPDAQFIATFDPSTVKDLLVRVKGLEAVAEEIAQVVEDSAHTHDDPTGETCLLCCACRSAAALSRLQATEGEDG